MIWFFSPDKIDKLRVWRKGRPLNRPFTRWSDVDANRLSNLLHPQVLFIAGQIVVAEILSVGRNGCIRYRDSVGQRRNGDLAAHTQRSCSVWRVLPLKKPNRRRSE